MKLQDDMLRVGVISQTHGIKGEVKVYPTTDDPTRFEVLENVYLRQVPQGMRGKVNDELVHLKIKGVKYFKQFVILKFDGIDNINDVEKYKGYELYVTREDAVPLEEGEYYIADLIGLKVIDEEEKETGVLKDVLQTGANDVYVVKGNMDYGNKEILIPVIKDCILNVDLENKVVKVHLLKGLVDYYQMFCTNSYRRN